jgi:hypothetical protein
MDIFAKTVIFSEKSKYSNSQKEGKDRWKGEEKRNKN